MFRSCGLRDKTSQAKERWLLMNVCGVGQVYFFGQRKGQGRSSHKRPYPTSPMGACHSSLIMASISPASTSTDKLQMVICWPQRQSRFLWPQLTTRSAVSSSRIVHVHMHMLDTGRGTYIKLHRGLSKIHVHPLRALSALRSSFSALIH